jgi:hypothetical protein
MLDSLHPHLAGSNMPHPSSFPRGDRSQTFSALAEIQRVHSPFMNQGRMEQDGKVV